MISAHFWPACIKVHNEVKRQSSFYFVLAQYWMVIHIIISIACGIIWYHAKVIKFYGSFKKEVKTSFSNPLISYKE